MVVYCLQGGGVGGADRTQSWHRRVLSRRGKLLCGGATYPWQERRELSAGIGRTSMVHNGVLIGSRRRLDNRGRCCGHQLETLGGRTAGGRIFNTDLEAP